MSDEPKLSRRDLFRGSLAGRPEPRPAERRTPSPTPAATRFPQAFPVLRPPGAVDEESFLAGCTRCNACLEACPHGAIRHAPERFRRAAGTPTIDPIQQPCWMCDDFPCIPVCEPRVLQMALPKQMGLVQIDVVNCLPYQGRECSRCVEECPIVGAIQLVEGKPQISAEVCTGCGVCQFVCPAPDNAILLMPLAERPAPPGGKAPHVPA